MAFALARFVRQPFKSSSFGDRNRSARRAKRHRILMETLESRVLLHGGALVLSDGVLTYSDLGEQAESIALNMSADQTQVEVQVDTGGVADTHAFDAAQVTSFVFDGKGIEDSFANNTALPATMMFGDGHMHGAEDKMLIEMDAAFHLVAYDFATNTTVQSGDWSDPATWGGVESMPGAGARIVITAGHELTVDGVFADTYMTIRVDGTLRFATDADTELRVDTLVTGPDSTFEMGTAANPIAQGVTAKIVIDDYAGSFETVDRESPDYDPFKLGLGIISHGRFVMHGQEKTGYATINGAVIGDTVLNLDEVPADWAVGDTIIIAGTQRGFASGAPKLILLGRVDRSGIVYAFCAERARLRWVCTLSGRFSWHQRTTCFTGIASKAVWMRDNGQVPSNAPRLSISPVMPLCDS